MSNSDFDNAETDTTPLFRTKQQLAKDWASVDPTATTYGQLRYAYGFLNRALFDDRLPSCLITAQRKAGMMGYFCRRRFESFDGAATTDEIALNPHHFVRGDKETLSTLAHEMVHLWQHHCGTVSRPGYHNEEWAQMMSAIGLIPSHTAAPGGQRTGQRMSHYIEPGGRFDRAANDLIAKGFVVAFVEPQSEEQHALKLKKRASKTRFLCNSCGQLAWAKAGSEIGCRRCDLPLVQNP